jgi:hypothetical protein
MLKKHALQCLMNVFEILLFIEFFQINSHGPMIYYELYYIKNLILSTPNKNYHF